MVSLRALLCNQGSLMSSSMTEGDPGQRQQVSDDVRLSSAVVTAEA